MAERVISRKSIPWVKKFESGTRTTEEGLRIVELANRPDTTRRLARVVEFINGEHNRLLGIK